MPPGEAGMPPGDTDQPPNLRSQLRATWSAVRRLIRAHRDLARAELDGILVEVKRVAVLAGVAIGALVLLGTFLPIGLALFLGDWLFGSIGWGVLHLAFLLVATAVVAGIAAVDTGARRPGRDLALALLLGIAAGVLFALDLPNAAWATIGESTGLAVDPGPRPLVIGVIVLGLVGAGLGLALGVARRSGGAAAAGLVGGAILGAILGAFSAITFGLQAGAAVGLTVALVAWPALAGIGLARSGVDLDALKAKFWPSVTIDTTKETIEWVKTQAPVGPRS